jgi:hypothetical protein
VRCIILGAGASYGYDDSLSEIQRPPLTDEIFRNGMILGIFSQEEYPTLYEKLKFYVTNVLRKPWSEPIEKMDVEEFMQWLANQFTDFSTSSEQEWMIRIKEGKACQAALGEMWYYLFNILKQYSILYRPTLDNYQRLALHYYKKHYAVISLNYDVLFELALLNVGCSYSYTDRNHPFAIPIAKIHGSINLFNSYSGSIRLSGLEDMSGFDLLPYIAPLIFSNRVYLHPPIHIDPRQIDKVDMNHLLRSGTDYFEPILIPPLGNYKDHEKVSIYKQTWALAERLLSETTELVVIGTKLREEDVQLCQAIQKNLPEGTRITTVSRNRGLINGRLKAILKWNKDPVVESYESFSQYTRSLL